MNKADYPNPSPNSKKANSPAQNSLPDKISDPSLSSEASPKTGTKESDLFVLAQKLRQRNRTLQEQVVQLQESLQVAEEKLHRQNQQFSDQESIRSQEVGTILSQQTAETSFANEQAGRLLHELENTHQLAQRQQILIETLSSELQTSQERIAQLERECALTQQKYNEQCHELLQAENRSQELNTRLQRQQRQALQFKLALEKSLEVPIVNQLLELPGQEETEIEISRKINPAALITRVQTQPIQPWSNPAESEGYHEEATTPERQQLAAAIAPEIFSLSDQSQFPKPEELRLNPTEEMMQPLILSLNSATPRLEPARESLFDVTEVGLDRFSLGSQNPFIPRPLEARLETRLESMGQAPDLAQYLMSLQPEPEMADISTNDQKLQQLLAVVKRSPYIPPESDEPAPIIYPQRPPKKIPSLSAINLPNFPRHRPPEN